MEEEAKSFAGLKIRIQNAWPEMPRIRKEEMVIDTFWGDIKNPLEYFSDRAFSEIDLSDPAICTDSVFFEAFTFVAMRYFSGKYLEFLLDRYEGSVRREWLAADHILSFLLSKRARDPKIGYSREQAAIIVDVLDYVAERVNPLDLYDGEDGILDAMYYWRERANRNEAAGEGV